MSSTPLASASTAEVLAVSLAFDATDGGLARLGLRVAEILGPTRCVPPGAPKGNDAAGLPPHRLLRDSRHTGNGPVLYVVEAPDPALLHLSNGEGVSDPVAVRTAEELGVRLIELRVSNTVVSFWRGLMPYTVLTILCFIVGMLISTVVQNEISPYYPMWAYSCQAAVGLAVIWIVCGFGAHFAMSSGCCSECCLPALRLLQVPLLLTVAFAAFGAGVATRRGFVYLEFGLAAIVLVPLYFALPVCYCFLAAAWGDGLNEVLDEDKLKYNFRNAGLLASDSPSAAEMQVDEIL